MPQKNSSTLEFSVKKTDLSLKKLFSKKVILGIMLKKVLPKFREIDLGRIIKDLLVDGSVYIEGNETVGANVTLLNQEPAIEMSGRAPDSRFDIHFLVRDPDDMNKVFGVDVELQGYEISLNREWAYACLAFCAQSGNPYVKSQENQPGVPVAKYDLFYYPVTIWVNFDKANPSKHNSIEASVAKAA